MLTGVFSDMLELQVLPKNCTRVEIEKDIQCADLLNVFRQQQKPPRLGDEDNPSASV